SSLRRSVADYGLDMSWDINAPPTTRVYNFTITEVQAAPDGVTRTMLLINGQFPGPVIRANRGDRLLVNVTNELTNGTTLHWHGIFQNGTNWMDGSTGVTQCPIPPGRSFLYSFTIENQYGTYWYHSHYSSQYIDGIAGPLIVHAPEEAETRKLYDFDQIVFLQDWYHDLSATLLPAYLAPENENSEPTPDTGLIQGTNYFDCSGYGPNSGYECHDGSARATFAVTQGKRYRLRFINAGAFAEFQVSIDNHTLSVIEADATIVDPVEVHRFEIHIAQRYSVILNANQTATNYWLRAQMNEFCFTFSNPVLDPNVRALITYVNSTDAPTESVDWSDGLDVACIDLNSTLMVPTVVEQAPPANVAYQINVAFHIEAYALDRAYINDTTWVPATVPTLHQAVDGLHASNKTLNIAGANTAFGQEQYVLNIPNVAVVDLLVNNLDEGAHPFHLHGQHFYIVADSAHGAYDWSGYPDNLNTDNPLRRDTLTLDAYGWAMIRFRADNPGLWPFHCHIAWHMEAGLLMQIQMRNDLMKDWTIPAANLALCNV
ncbi:multicopper like protein, partial [Xylogone sp. PMI_703]